MQSTWKHNNQINNPINIFQTYFTSRRPIYWIKLTYQLQQIQPSILPRTEFPCFCYAVANSIRFFEITEYDELCLANFSNVGGFTRDYTEINEASIDMGNSSTEQIKFIHYIYSNKIRCSIFADKL